MSFNDCPAGIDATALSERARALLACGGSLSARQPDTAPTSLLIWLLLVMPVARWWRFTDHLGMLGAAPALRLVLDGKRVATLRERLGQELYLFGMQHAPLMGAFAVPVERFENPQAIETTVRATGVEALQAFCEQPDGENAVLRARLSIRLAAFDSPPAPAPSIDAPSGALLQRLMRYTEPTLATALHHSGEGCP